jgi:hypothetical protein
MSYKVGLSRRAFDPFFEPGARTLTSTLLGCIAANLDRLGTDPVGLSERALVPYPVSGQLFHFTCVDGGVSLSLVAIFNYAPGEQALQVLQIRMRRQIL